jgi:prolyl-tRNA editing enzyme YbaK/EbsC (Cys-tRNA(Pro) deacylase)
MAAGSGSTLRVETALAAAGLADRVLRYDATTTRTSADAAAAIGCAVAQIAKTMVFRTEAGAVLVIASGDNRVDEVAVARLLERPVGRADADYVRAATGFAIGGVSPIGLAGPAPLAVLIDADLARLDPLWAAAGDANSVFRLSYAELLALTGGRPAEIAKR